MRLPLLAAMLLCSASDAAYIDYDMLVPLGGGYDYTTIEGHTIGEPTTDGVWYGSRQYWNADEPYANIDYTFQSTYPQAYLSTYIDGFGELSSFIDFTSPSLKYELWPNTYWGIDNAQFYLDGEPLSLYETVWTAPGQHRLSWDRSGADISAVFLVVEIPEPSSLSVVCIGLSLAWLSRLVLRSGRGS